MTDPRVRRVHEADLPAVVRLVHDLAAYERAPEQCHLTEEQLRTVLFGPSPAVYGHVAEAGGEIVGCALWFLSFSTWEGVHGIYLEDLFVSPEQRGSGLGKALLEALAEECVARGYARLEWAVLDWNEPSIAFYEALGARPQSGWSTYRLTGDALQQLGS
jgi:GNAT superfamily N-acetyltransferase